MDRLESMSILVTVVEAGSMSAAGRRLGMPLATVSRRVSELEAHIKTRLLNRSTRQLTLTDAGRAYVMDCKRILEEVEGAERAASGEYSAPKGNLVITAPIVFGRLHVLPITTAFLKAYPDVDVRLVLVDRLINLLEEHVDLAVRISELPDSGLIATRVGAIRQVVCGSPSYFAEYGTPNNPTELSAHHCVTFEGLMSSEAWIFKMDKSEVSVPVHSRLIVNTAEAAIDAAIAGVGIARVLSYQIADAMRTGTLVLVLQEFEPPPAPVSLVYTSQRLLPLKLRTFLDFAAPRLRSILQSAT